MHDKSLFFAIMRVYGKNVDDNAVIVNGINEPMLTIDTARPHASQRVSQSLWHTNARIGMLGNIGKQEFNAVYNFYITALDKSVIMGYCRFGKYYSVHVTRSKSSSIDSPSCWAVTRP